MTLVILILYVMHAKDPLNHPYFDSFIFFVFQGMCTPLEIFLGMAGEGYNLEYKRVPMSRERTPRAGDLDHLYMQTNSQQGKQQKVYYLFISRTATGSSARFAAAFACSCLMNSPLNQSLNQHEDLRPKAKKITASTGLIRHDSESSEMARSIELGEYRGIMNLCRVLPSGGDAKKAVDDAIAQCKHIGNLKEDILKCKQMSEDDNTNASEATSARRLGLHYLQRYFYLIAFRAYLESTRLGGPDFSEWVSERQEITYLLSVLELE